ncbi:RDD family protein [Marinomonas mediterranea]|uniref:RDD family protein n=1 Tax=Marinomonas mediterranea TaxID=119864 RepID=UPI00234965AB|nr:RDD family protein [Marinomonas mediterranea]WCN13647.1 RDD family protein [Marinomonas mediterranea]
MEDVQEKWVCGFWRRIGALFIDTLVLGIFGYVVGLLLEDAFVQLGGWGRLIGFFVSITYFGVMNSSLSNGQTIGKKILNIKVVDSSNSTISLPKSFLRYSFLAVPFSLNGAQITNEALLSYLMYPLSFIIFGGLFSISYLYVFNRVTRQSLHDLVVGTYVVNAEVSSEELNSVWKPHLGVVAGLFIAAALVPAFTSGLAKSEPFKGLLATQEAINSNEAVKYAGVTEGSSTFTSSDSGSTTTTYVNTQAFLFENNVDDPDTAKQLAQTIIKTYPESLNKNLIQVTLTYGYDIGIASKWNSYNHQFNPQELKGSE